MGIIFTALTIIVPAYLNGNTDTTLLVHVKNAAGNACSYLNTGVVVEDSVHAPLNGIIGDSNYSSLWCRVRGVSIVSSNKTQVSVKVVVVYRSGVTPPSELGDAVGSFVVGALKSRSGFSESNGVLWYGEKAVTITVEAVRE